MAVFGNWRTPRPIRMLLAASPAPHALGERRRTDRQPFVLLVAPAVAQNRVLAPRPVPVRASTLAGGPGGSSNVSRPVRRTGAGEKSGETSGETFVLSPSCPSKYGPFFELVGGAAPGNWPHGPFEWFPMVPPSPHAWGQTTYHLEGDSNLLLCGVT